MDPLLVIFILVAFVALLLALTVLRQLSKRLSAVQEERPFAFAIGVALVLGTTAVVGLSFYPNLDKCWSQHRMACIWMRN